MSALLTRSSHISRTLHSNKSDLFKQVFNCLINNKTVIRNQHSNIRSVCLFQKFPTLQSSTRHFACSPNSHSDQIVKPPQRPSKKSTDAFQAAFNWKSLAIGCSVFGALFGYMQYLKHEKTQKEALRKQGTSVGKSLLGGDWDLIDTEERPVSNKDFIGRWTLLYFGFTHCPDVCPEELDKLVKVIDRVDANKKLPHITPIFITVDSERDTPKQIKEYIKEFSPKIVGLTGTPDQIRTVTRAYRIYYSPGPKDIDNDYIVDHSIISYLVDPEGRFLQYYGQDKMEDEMYESICKKVQQWEPSGDV